MAPASHRYCSPLFLLQVTSHPFRASWPWNPDLTWPQWTWYCKQHLFYSHRLSQTYWQLYCHFKSRTCFVQTWPLSLLTSTMVLWSPSLDVDKCKGIDLFMSLLLVCQLHILSFAFVFSHSFLKHIRSCSKTFKNCHNWLYFKSARRSIG